MSQLYPFQFHSHFLVTNYRRSELCITKFSHILIENKILLYRNRLFLKILDLSNVKAYNWSRNLLKNYHFENLN